MFGLGDHDESPQGGGLMQISLTAGSYYDLLIAGAFVLGAIAACLWVRLRLRADFDRKLSRLESEKALLGEKLQAQDQGVAELHERLNQSQKESSHYQSLASDLHSDKAALEARAQRIPALEQELLQIKEACAALQNDLRKESAALAQAREKGLQLERMEAEKNRREEQILVLQEQSSRLKTEMAELRTVLGEERKQADEKIALLHEAREELKNQFQNLAQRIFDERGRTFTELNKNSIEHLINPLRDQIGDFKKRVEDVYDKESRDRAALQTEIHHLKELNQRISKEALNLTRALKGDSKARGNWGEVVLERVLEASGLQKGREYDVQVSLKDASGKRYQPDVIVRLPQGKDVVVDAKVSLKDYETYYSAEEPAEKESALKAHIEAIRTHIRSLAGKSYEALEGVRSLDFVLMFVPVEAAFIAAVERDRELFREAFEQNILVVSPSTLLVTLRTIENIWRNAYQNRNALEIAKKAGALYDKFVGFLEALQEVGQQLDKAKAAYQTASDRIVSGRGNLIRRAEELKTLGVKAGKEMPQNLVEMAPEPDDLGSA
jgi:DNA recombination protein RmuC